jgi:hypothetical protein
MRTFKAGVALALVGGVLLAPLGAAGRRQDGVISGSAIAEVKGKEPYTKYSVRARDVNTNQIVQSTALDAQAQYALNALAAGSFIVELVRDAAPGGQGGKVVCSEGPFTLRDQAAQNADSMLIRGADIQCQNPAAAYWLLGAAAAAGLTAGIVAGGDPASPAN